MVIRDNKGRDLLVMTTGDHSDRSHVNGRRAGCLHRRGSTQSPSLFQSINTWRPLGEASPPSLICRGVNRDSQRLSNLSEFLQLAQRWGREISNWNPGLSSSTTWKKEVGRDEVGACQFWV